MAGSDHPEARAAVGQLLGEADPPAVTVMNRQGRSPFLLIGDHAGNRVPALLGTLGLPSIERERHIGWDIGVGALGEALAARLDAVFVRQTYSRLVIDCNRDPGSVDAIPETSDGTAIPGNASLSAEDRAARVAAIHEPYQQAIAAEIARRTETILISLHSFTPAMGGVQRPWDIGVLHDGADDDYALGLLARLRARTDLVVGDNAPYKMDATDHTVPRHAFAAKLPYAELEIRQDRLASGTDIAFWATLLGETL